MNNHGWGLRVMLGFCGILALCIIIVAVIVDQNFKNFGYYQPPINNNKNDEKPGHNYIPLENQSDYRQIESKMINAAQDYVAVHYSNGAPEGTRLTITLKSLQNDNKINQIKDPNNGNFSCSGYVNVLKDTNVENYEPYLKCGDRYETSGYFERLDDNN